MVDRIMSAWPEGSFVLGPVGQMVMPGEGSVPAIEVVSGWYIVVTNGLIADVVPGEAKERLPTGLPYVDASSCCVTPGFIDCHTHTVFGGWRFDEYEMRLSGATYKEIMAAGGGIVNTVRATRDASDEVLTGRVARFLDGFKRCGVTTVEIKSGYGLDVEHELRCLHAASSGGEAAGVKVICTFMGAHALLPEYKSCPDRYVDLVVEEMIPAVAEQGLAEFCDVFCEHGAFTVEQSRRILLAGKDRGLKPKIHADELGSTGGAELAAEVGAVSAEHLLQASTLGLERLAEAGVSAVLLPGTSFSLHEGYAPARKLIELGVPISVATDFNPGSSPIADLRFVMNLACSRLHLTPEEVMWAVTAGAARALDRQGAMGIIAPGVSADLAVWDVDDYRELIAVIGHNPLRQLYVEGCPQWA